MSGQKSFQTPWNVWRTWHCLTLLDTSEFAKFAKLGRWIHASNIATQEPLRDVSVEQGTLAEILLSKCFEIFKCLSLEYQCLLQDRSAMRWKTSRFGDSEIDAVYQRYFYIFFMYIQHHSARQSSVFMLLEVPSTFFGSMFGCLPDASMCLDKTLAEVIPEQITSVGILISSFETS